MGTSMNGRQELHEAMLRMPPLIGERLCLDFVNSIEPRGDPYLSQEQRVAQRDYLTSYTDFLVWSVHASIMTEEEAWPLLKQASLQASHAEETFKQIIALREELYMLFWKVASFQVVPEQALEWLQQSYVDTLSHAQLIKAERQYIWQWKVEKEYLASPTWPIMQSALELLTAGDLTRLKLCPGTPGVWMACSWLFYDESKNRSRHWCSMTDCGGRAKANRQTARRRIKRKQHQL